MEHFQAAASAVEAAVHAGAAYADARVGHERYETMTVRNGEVGNITQNESIGIGVRVLVDSSWGFASTSDLSPGRVHQATSNAVAAATAAASMGGRPIARLVPCAPAVGSWHNQCLIDPLSVGLSEKGDLLVAATQEACEEGATVAEAHYQIWDTRKWFMSSEGHQIEQHLRACGGGISSTVVGADEVQRRSYPSYRGQYGTRGWELINELNFTAHAARITEEAKALSKAPPCPAGEVALILGSEQLALQIHESVAHAIELDRILGWEAGFAGTSWLDLTGLGSLRYGSELMNISIDPTIPGALGSFGFDDEGTPATRRMVVRDGIWVGVLAGRDSAFAAGLDYGGSVRAGGWASLPLVRLTNVGIEPGPHTLDEIIASTADGVYMDGNRSWSIDDRRLRFEFTCELGREVKNGKLGRIVRNPRYGGSSPTYWRSLDMLSSEREIWGTPKCGKGQPLQLGHAAHPAAPARFQKVIVGHAGA